jgi:hypothetical protein
VVVAIEEWQNMDVLSIPRSHGKLQAHEERINKIQEDNGCTKFVFIAR